MFIKAERVSNSRVRYWDNDGSSVVFIGGNRTWRNQNPGNIGAGPWANRHGAIGAAGDKRHKFAIFPSYEVGRTAIFDLLKSPDYIYQKIFNAISHYAHAGENDVIWYRNLVKKVTGLDLNRMIKSLNKEELSALVDAIERAEGNFKSGKTIKEQKKKKISSIRKNKKGTIIAYFIDSIGWVSKDKGISLAENDKIDAVVAISRSGNPYLRTRPDAVVENNLDNLG